MLKLVCKCAQKIACDRASAITREMLPLIDGDGPILDLGCGVGHVGFEVAEATHREVCFLDVRKYPFTHPKVSVQLYDGEKIPYENHFFDISLAIFTLHHTRDARETLREMVRVTVRNLIVFEDMLPTRKLLLFQILKDMLNNYFFEGPALQHKTEEEWESLFAELKLEVLRKIHFGTSSVTKCQHVGWLLKIV